MTNAPITYFSITAADLDYLIFELDHFRQPVDEGIETCFDQDVCDRLLKEILSRSDRDGTPARFQLEEEGAEIVQMLLDEL